MYELTIIKKDGGTYIDSREVAEAIGKRHDHLLRDIGKYREIIMKIIDPKNGLNDFFIGSSYVDSIGRTLPCYLISKMGCELVANKLTGEKGVLFTTAYVKKFNEMEAAEREAEIKSHARPRLSEFNSAVKNVLNGLAYCFAAPKRVMNFLRGAYEPFGIDVLPESDDSSYFTVTAIAAQLGIYSDTGRPHGHAVSAIISKLENHANHAVAVPYGLVGVTFRYDSHIVEAVRNWITENNSPREVPHQGFDYHIYYDRQLSLFDDGDDKFDFDYEE
jgi:Rha family phage regulatory protein